MSCYFLHIKLSAIMGQLKNLLQDNRYNETNFQIRIPTNPFATPVLADPPPPATNTCLLVSICTLNRGKLIRAKTLSIFLLCGAIYSQCLILSNQFVTH